MSPKERDERDDDVADTATPAPDDDRPREKKHRSKSERKDRDKDRDREKDRDKDRDKDKEKRREHRSSRSTRSKHSEGSELSSHRRHRSSKKDRDDDGGGSRVKKSRSISASDFFAGESSASLDRLPRISLPYPSFSKAHSKEAVHSKEDVSTASRRSNPFTPDTTDVGDGEVTRSKSAEFIRESSSSKKASRPPTPPDTDVSADKKHEKEQREEDYIEDNEADQLQRPKSRTSGPSRSASLRDVRSKVSDKSRSSSQATYVKSAPNKSHDKLRSDSRASSSSRRSVKRSSSHRHSKKDPESLEADSPPSTPQDSSPRTPTQSAQFSPHVYGGSRPEPSATPDIDRDESDIPSKTATPASAIPMPPPPPPPPPPVVDIQDLPRVDYLLQNGGLAYPAPKNFLAVLPRQNGTRPSNPPLTGVDTLFAPFFNLLDQYSTVINKQGSIAVATGHKSIARRLLDRLENVFSRDLPPHGCSCVLCDRNEHEIHRGLTWGDVLEWVSGRIELPQWPPFDLAEIGTKAAEIEAEAPPRPASPVKMDPDIDEQFREHYLRQSKKVRSAVDKWLNKTADTPVPPPQDVDDETLSFAVLTSLDLEDRPFFNALMSGSREVRPATRAPTPSKHHRNDFIIKCGLSLQRLYRLQQVPRDAETVTYLIRNPHTHDLLVTLSNINNSEWEILTSGRFDGFLWSGADGEGLESRGPTPADRSTMMSPGPRAPSAMSSRNTTPFSPYSRGATPASFVSLNSSSMPNGRQPVSNDEEMEMAVIAEIERDIYSGMESLEDAFEKLHHQAEIVRNALRERGAGLMQNLQNRKRIDVLSTPAGGQTPGWQRGSWDATASDADGGSDSEWGMDDFEIMPDDSASNISSSRHRRPKRRTERRTPAPIEEDDEE